MTQMKKERSSLKNTLSYKSLQMGQEDKPCHNDGKPETLSRSYSSAVAGAVLPQLLQSSKSSPLCHSTASSGSAEAVRQVRV